MSLIRRIINWIIKIFRWLFGNKKISKKVKSSINKQSNKHYFKEYGLNKDTFNSSFPIYLMIDEIKKRELIDKIKLLEDKINEDERKVLEDLIKKIEKKPISFYQNELINEKVENVLEDTKIEVNTKEKIISLDKEVIEVLENYDKNIKEKTKKEYEIVNYVTLTTLLIDETEIEIKKLYDDFHHHKHNKYYYDRELKKIRKRLNNLRKLRENESVLKEIETLKKDLYTKKKDKYDLLYNDEVFYSLDKTCDDLIKKVNRRIIDLKAEKEEKKLAKKEKKEEKVEEKKENKDKVKEEKELLENILKRFQDIELARKILLLQNKDIEIKDQKDLMAHVNDFYLEFIGGEKFKFNFDRNKTKLELVKLINNINQVESFFTKEEFIPLEHINYSMTDLIDLAILQKDELDSHMQEKFNYQKDKYEVNILVDNKLNIIKENELGKEEKAHVLVKTNNEK